MKVRREGWGCSISSWVIGVGKNSWVLGRPFHLPVTFESPWRQLRDESRR